MHIQLFILLLVVLVKSNHCERVLRFVNGEKSISKLSIGIWVFHSHVHHVAHMHREPASVAVVVENERPICDFIPWLLVEKPSPLCKSNVQNATGASPCHTPFGNIWIGAPCYLAVCTRFWTIWVQPHSSLRQPCIVNSDPFNNWKPQSCHLVCITCPRNVRVLDQCLSSSWWCYVGIDKHFNPATVSHPVTQHLFTQHLLMQRTEEHKVVVFIKPRSWVLLNGFCDRIEGLVYRDNRSLSTFVNTYMGICQKKLHIG